MKGKDDIIKTLENRLKIKLGETTPDNIFSFLGINCIGWCHEGPAMLINDKVYIVWGDENDTDGAGTDRDIFLRVSSPPLYFKNAGVNPIFGNTSNIFIFSSEFQDMQLIFNVCYENIYWINKFYII